MPKLSSKYYRIWIFIVGVIATIAYRAVIFFSGYSQTLLEIAWYVGTLGFVWYFAHRWRIENRRDQLVTKLELERKISTGEALNKEDKEALAYILKGLRTSLAKWNYILIFIFSFIALAYAIYIDIAALVR